MNMKLKRILDDIQKTEEKIREWQEHLEQLNIQKKQMEDIEIVKSIRSMKLDSRELLLLLDGIQKGSVQLEGITPSAAEEKVQVTSSKKYEKNGVERTSESEETYEA